MEKVDEHTKQIEKLFEHVHEIKNENHELHLKLTKIEGDVGHIRVRIDNGMSVTIATMSKDLKDLATTILSQVLPVCEDSKYWIDKVKQSFFWLATIGVGGGFIGVIFVAIRAMVNNG